MENDENQQKPVASLTHWLEDCPVEIWESVFSCMRDMDSHTLAKCRETCRDFKFWVDKRTSFWSRVSLMSAVEDNNLSLCRLIMENTEDKNPVLSKDDGVTKGM